MLRAAFLLAALPLFASGALAQNRFEAAQAKGAFVVVKPSGKPFATAPIRPAAPQQDHAARHRTLEPSSGVTFAPDETTPDGDAADAPAPPSAQPQKAQRQPASGASGNPDSAADENGEAAEPGPAPEQGDDGNGTTQD